MVLANVTVLVLIDVMVDFGGWVEVTVFVEVVVEVTGASVCVGVMVVVRMLVKVDVWLIVDVIVLVVVVTGALVEDTAAAIVDATKSRTRVRCKRCILIIVNNTIDITSCRPQGDVDLKTRFYHTFVLLYGPFGSDILDSAQQH